MKNSFKIALIFISLILINADWVDKNCYTNKAKTKTICKMDENFFCTILIDEKIRCYEINKK